MTSRPFVEISAPHKHGPDRFDIELSFPAASRQRAEQHQRIAWELALIHGVDARTPYKINPRWSVYEENWGSGARHGSLDHRRLDVSGQPQPLARYLTALRRVLAEVESLATRAARAFGSWRRSPLAEQEGHLEYEDAQTLSVRAREFRLAVLRALAGLVAQGACDPGLRDASRPLWEQAGVVAAEVWTEAGGISVQEASTEQVQVELDRMLPNAEPVAKVAQDDIETRVPDTVAELLELAGPAGAAPTEHAPEPVHQSAAPPVAAPSRSVPALPPERERCSAASRAPVRHQQLHSLPASPHRPGAEAVLTGT
ncbi:hypothetical protein ACIOG4_28010 [Streptomyces microflavus]|uniref:hypothetical protein n=1 Tax=Streptomyces microflavus TaxID=1919 RepID=UPI00381BD865